MNKMSWRKAAVIGVCVALSAFIWIFSTSNAISITWDEPIYAEVAERAATWFGIVLHGKWDTAFDPMTFGFSWGLDNEHPPLTRVINGLGWALTRGFLQPPIVHRIGAMVFASFGLGIIAALIAYDRGLRVSVFSVAAILTMPRAFFHAHLITLDFPVAIVWLGTSLIFYQVMKTTPLKYTFRVVLRRALILGFLLGLGLLTKINTALLLPFWLTWLLLRRRSWGSVLIWMLSLPVAALTLILGWPWMWRNPVSGIINWLSFFHSYYAIPQWFLGRMYLHNLPWWLPFAIILVVTPVILLVLAVMGMARRRYASASLSDWLDLHLLGLLIILGWFALPNSHLHDADRMLLPTSFHLAVLSGEGFDVLWLWMTKKVDWFAENGRRLAAQVVFATILLLPGVFGIAKLHPFELAYYNALVGGVRGGEKAGLTTIYFASTYGAFLPELNELPADSKIWVMPNSFDVLYYYQVYGMLRPDLIMLRPPGWGSFYDYKGVRWAEGWIDESDYALIERRQTDFNDQLPNHDRILDWAYTHPELSRIERCGVTLSGLYSR